MGVGIVIALFAARLVRSLLFEIGPTDPTTFVVMVVGLLLVGVLTTYIPARRATKVDPLTAIRAE